MVTKQTIGIFLKLIIALCLSIPVQAAEGLCFPVSREVDATAWPICAVYMHGLFGKAPYLPSIWEVPFRKKFEQLALEKRCRIAAPFGDQGNYRNWNSVSLTEALTRARAVCGGASFARSPAIIGFSNGANRLRKFGGADCSSLQRFSRVTLIGPTGTRGNPGVLRCGNVHIHQAHVVPSYEFLRESVP